MQRLLEWLQARSGRERRVLAGGAALALVLLVLVIVLPLGRAVTGATARIEAKHADLAWMRGVAAELAAAGPPRLRTPRDRSRSSCSSIARRAKRDSVRA